MNDKIWKNLYSVFVGGAVTGVFLITPFFYSLENTAKKHLKQLKDYKPIENKGIDSLFSYLNSGLREYIDKVYITDKSHFKEGYVGHVHENVICLVKDYNKEYVFHESAHVRNIALDPVFSEKWKAIANFKYGKQNSIENPAGKFKWKDGTACPRDGLLSPYSSLSIKEDIATFVECLDPVRRSYLSICNSEDERYKKKLDLLKEYGFFTEKEYKTLNGCLENTGFK